MEYDVIWGDGPLGLTLRPDLGEDMPPVVGRITNTDSAASLAKVQPGHLLINVNGKDTGHRGYERTVQLLQSVTRPATLRFRVPRNVNGENDKFRLRPSSASADGAPFGRSRTRSRRSREYTIIWSEGSLGMILHPHNLDPNIPCILKLTGKGTGTGIENAKIGDRLLSVNGQDTKSIGFKSTVSILKTHRKPLVLKFRRSRRKSRDTSLSNEQNRTYTRQISASSEAAKVVSDYGVYDIVWRKGQLGLKLKPGPKDTPIVSRLTGKGNASGLHNAAIGDILMSVSGQNIEKDPYQDTLRLLKTVEKPVILRFRPCNAQQRTSISSVTSGVSAMPAPPLSNGQQQYQFSDFNTPSSKLTPLPMSIQEEGEHEAESVAASESSASRLKRKGSSRSRDASSSRSRSRHREPDEENRISKKDITLEVARQVVCKTKMLDPFKDTFGGILIYQIKDGTKASHYLKLKAKKYIREEAERNKESLKRKEAYTKAQRERKILEESMEQMKEEAKRYQEMLAEAERQKILSTATKDKPQQLIGLQNIMLKELSNVIEDYRKSSYSEFDYDDDEDNEYDEFGNYTEPVLDDDTRKSLMDDIEGVLRMSTTFNNDNGVIVEGFKTCADCGVSENHMALELDDDGQYYCMKCWETFLGMIQGGGETPVNGQTVETDMIELTAVDISDQLGNDELVKDSMDPVDDDGDEEEEEDRNKSSSSSTIRVSKEIEENDAESGIENSLKALDLDFSESPSTPKGDAEVVKTNESKPTLSSLTGSFRISNSREEEEAARKEAEKKIKEIEMLRRSGSLNSLNATKSALSARASLEKEERDRIGEKEFLEALKAEKRLRTQSQVSSTKRSSQNDETEINVYADIAENSDEDYDKIAKKAEDARLRAAAAEEEQKYWEEKSAIILEKQSSMRSRDSALSWNSDQSVHVIEDESVLDPECIRKEALRQDEERKQALERRRKAATVDVVSVSPTANGSSQDPILESQVGNKIPRTSSSSDRSSTSNAQQQQTGAMGVLRRAASEKMGMSGADSDRQSGYTEIDDEPSALELQGNKKVSRVATYDSSSESSDFDETQSEYERRLKDAKSEDKVRELEGGNIELAKQLQEAHSVMERVRDSFVNAGGHDGDMPFQDDETLRQSVGLSEEQIQLFKKLTATAEERASVVDAFRSIQEESGSDSDSSDSDFNDSQPNEKAFEVIEEGDETEGVWI